MPRRITHLTILALLLLVNSCTRNVSKEVLVSGMMRDVMWNGDLEGKILLDSLDKKNLYGLGPLEYLRGEIMVLNGTTYVSTVDADSSMVVSIDENVKAPFFVYAYNSAWEELVIPGPIENIKEFEKAFNAMVGEGKEPFVFRIDRIVDDVRIHTQNLAPGTKVSSPDEAHSGQQNFRLTDTEVSIVGFYSTRHKGIFTHHDSNMHMHLIDSEREHMGHLDDISTTQDLTIRIQVR